MPEMRTPAEANRNLVPALNYQPAVRVTAANPYQRPV
jgi:hypothetical protein